MFFFEKKNQKTFAFEGGIGSRRALLKKHKSLFASFSSEKEDSSFLPTAPQRGDLPTIAERSWLVFSQRGGLVPSACLYASYQP